MTTELFFIKTMLFIFFKLLYKSFWTKVLFHVEVVKSDFIIKSYFILRKDVFIDYLHSFVGPILWMQWWGGTWSRRRWIWASSCHLAWKSGAGDCWWLTFSCSSWEWKNICLGCISGNFLKPGIYSYYMKLFHICETVLFIDKPSLFFFSAAKN